MRKRKREKPKDQDRRLGRRSEPMRQRRAQDEQSGLVYCAIVLACHFRGLLKDYVELLYKTHISSSSGGSRPPFDFEYARL